MNEVSIVLGLAASAVGLLTAIINLAEAVLKGARKDDDR